MEKRINFGYEPNYEFNNFDPNIYQGFVNTCAIRAQEIILRDYGIMIPQEDLIKYATTHGWFDPSPENGGTPKEAMGNLLEACNVGITRTENATIYDIIAELRAGHRVLVSLDADELWLKDEPDLFKRMTGEVQNQINDKIQNFLGIDGANHALVVAGVNINPNDPSDIKVTLIDSGNGKVCIEYDYKDFLNAWSDGHCLMISTNEPAPFQYNHKTREMEPSGFNTAFMPSTNELPEGLTNSFQLTSNYYEHFEHYEPIFDGTELQIPYQNSITNISKEIDNCDALSNDFTTDIFEELNLQPINEIQDPIYTSQFEEHVISFDSDGNAELDSSDLLTLNID